MDQKYTISESSLKELMLTLGDIYVDLPLNPERPKILMAALKEIAERVEEKKFEDNQADKILRELKLLVDVLMRKEYNPT